MKKLISMYVLMVVLLFDSISYGATFSYKSVKELNREIARLKNCKVISATITPAQGGVDNIIVITKKAKGKRPKLQIISRKSCKCESWWGSTFYSFQNLTCQEASKMHKSHLLMLSLEKLNWYNIGAITVEPGWRGGVKKILIFRNVVY